MRKVLNIKSKIQNYNIYSESKLEKIFKDLPKDAIYIVDDKIYNLFLKKYLKRKIYLKIFSNEKAKDFKNLDKILNFYLKHVTKNIKIIAIGGGVVQDVVSFISSIFRRGIDWYFIPSTIISQGDSCIGGKTSINFKGIKNQLGNFYPPKKIILNELFIQKLPKDEFFSGLGEMSHYYYLSNKRDFFFFRKQLLNLKNINLKKLIINSLKIKKKFIEIDEFDKKERLVLNYGHTFGHAIEKLTLMPHGISVAFGMDIANYISLKNKLLKTEEYNEMKITSDIILKKYKLPNININNFINLLKKDKKSIKGKIRVILSRGIGNMFLSEIRNLNKFKKDIKSYFKINQIQYS
jgi:3-dehydroquinate synthase